MRSSIVALLGVLAIASCDRLIGPSRGRTLRTDATSYALTRTSAGYEARIIATYRNESNVPVFMEGCLPRQTRPVYGFQRTGPDRDLRLWTSIGWACVGGVPGIPIAPGTVREDTLRFFSAHDVAATPRPQPEWRVGQMRVCYALVNTAEPEPGAGARLPESQRCSNDFEIRFAPVE